VPGRVAAIEFGIFDHVTRPAGVSLADLYEGRIALLRKADAAGFRGFHLAEHHGHGLSATPSQAVFLAALARETERLRLGMLVACLPLHHPVRLAEEICMLDQLCGGRLDLGVGRGISPFEHRLFGHDPDESRERFAELLPMVLRGLATGRLDSAGSAHYDFPEIELPVAPWQRPYPPLWAAGNVEVAARNGMNVISGIPITAEMRRRYDALWAESRGDPDRLNPHVATPLVGSSHFVCIADSDEEARRVGRRALAAVTRRRGRVSGSSSCRRIDALADLSVRPARFAGVGRFEIFMGRHDRLGSRALSPWSRTWSGARRRETSGSPPGSGSPSCPRP